MVEQYFLSETGGVDVGVDLGGGYGLVAEHGLDGTEIGTAFEQGGGEGVTEGVGRDGLPNAGFLHKIFDHEEDHDAGEGLLAAMADEDVVLILMGNGQEVAVLEIELKLVDGFLGDGHEPLLGAFALDLDEFLFEKEVAEFQIDEFRHPQSATEEGLDDGFVAMSLGLAEVDDGLDGIDFIDSQHIRQHLGFLGKLEQFGGIGLQYITEHQKVVEAAHPRKDARKRDGLNAYIEHEGGEVVEVFELNSERILAFVLDEPQELVEVTHVSIDGVGRESLLQFQILIVAAQKLLQIFFFHRAKVNILN